MNTKIVNKMINIQTGENLDWDKVESLKDNAMLKVKPELWIEWDFEKNSDSGLDIYDITKASNTKVWWICPKCKSGFCAQVRSRYVGSICSYCSGKLVNHTNCLSTTHPKLASEWHPTLNEKLTPDSVTYGKSLKVWWMGKCGHEWEATLNHRSRGKGCPYCAGQKILIGFNDIWTTNPHLASQLLNPEDGYKYMQQSNTRADWKCSRCDTIVKNKVIGRIYVHGLSCPRCSDGISYPEKVMFNLLKQLPLSFDRQKRFAWSDNKSYDFYTVHNDENILIETHGLQHYEECFISIKDAKNLEEEQENDRYKERLAKENGINRYIVIDCRYSNLNFIKNNILNSEISNLISMDAIDWNKIAVDSENSIVLEVNKLWNKGIKNIQTLCNETKLSYSTVHKYLRKGKELGWIQ